MNSTKKMPVEAAMEKVTAPARTDSTAPGELGGLGKKT